MYIVHYTEHVRSFSKYELCGDMICGLWCAM